MSVSRWDHTRQEDVDATPRRPSCRAESQHNRAMIERVPFKHRASQRQPHLRNSSFQHGEMRHRSGHSGGDIARPGKGRKPALSLFCPRSQFVFLFGTTTVAVVAVVVVAAAASAVVCGHNHATTKESERHVAQQDDRTRRKQQNTANKFFCCWTQTVLRPVRRSFLGLHRSHPGV